MSLSINRREFIQASAMSALAAACPLSPLGVSKASELSRVVRIDLGWGMDMDDATQQSEQATKLVSEMNRALSKYQVQGWAEEARWAVKMKNGKERLSLKCAPLVASANGYPIFRRSRV